MNRLNYPLIMIAIIVAIFTIATIVPPVYAADGNWEPIEIPEGKDLFTLDAENNIVSAGITSSAGFVDGKVYNADYLVIKVDDATYLIKKSDVNAVTTPKATSSPKQVPISALIMLGVITSFSVWGAVYESVVEHRKNLLLGLLAAIAVTAGLSYWQSSPCSATRHCPADVLPSSINAIIQTVSIGVLTYASRAGKFAIDSKATFHGMTRTAADAAAQDPDVKVTTSKEATTNEGIFFTKIVPLVSLPLELTVTTLYLLGVWGISLFTKTVPFLNLSEAQWNLSHLYVIAAMITIIIEILREYKGINGWSEFAYLGIWFAIGIFMPWAPCYTILFGWAIDTYKNRSVRKFTQGPSDILLCIIVVVGGTFLVLGSTYLLQKTEVATMIWHDYIGQIVIPWLTSQFA